MNKSILLTAVLSITILLGCDNKPGNGEQAESVKEETESKDIKGATYAEISIKEGGQWVGRKYEGGDKFVNVTSLNVPESHTDHSYFIRYEGPGWESDKVGYRLYLDWRNAIDIFGKVTDTLVLKRVGQDGFDSYHEMNDWGMDILKAGKSLGVGSLGRLVDEKVLHFNQVDSTKAAVENSADQSAVLVNYYGWETENEKTDISSRLSIKPLQRITKHTFRSSEALDGISTGIVKFDSIPMVQKTSDNGKWGYIATYGIQSLVPDHLGMVVFYRTEDVTAIKEGEFDHLIVFKASKDPVTYYFAGAWEKEKNGISTQEEFISYIDQKLDEFSTGGGM